MKPLIDPGEFAQDAKPIQTLSEELLRRFQYMVQRCQTLISPQTQISDQLAKERAYVINWFERIAVQKKLPGQVLARSILMLDQLIYDSQGFSDLMLYHKESSMRESWFWTGIGGCVLDVCAKQDGIKTIFPSLTPIMTGTVSDLFQLELMVLTQLNFDLGIPTAADFALEILYLFGMDSQEDKTRVLDGVVRELKQARKPTRNQLLVAAKACFARFNREDRQRLLDIVNLSIIVPLAPQLKMGQAL